MGVPDMAVANHRRSTPAGDCLFSQDIPSDVSVIVGGTAYALHKFPLVARCGWIRCLVAEAKDPDLSKIELPDLPGGAETFELAAKFCYGINFEIDLKNVISLRCAAEYLDMSEEYTTDNLICRTDAFIEEVVLNSFQSCVAALQACESLLPIAEEVGIVARCADALASKACRDQITSTLSRSDLSCSSGRIELNGALGSSPGFTHTPKRKLSIEWWADEILTLRIDSFHRVLIAMKDRGIRNDRIGAAVAYYAQRWLRGLLIKHTLDARNRSKPKSRDSTISVEHEQRILVETLVNLLPMERNVTTVSFVCALLRIATYLDTTVACRLDLERRIGWQLEQATVDDLLIPSYSYNGDTFFDLDTVSRIVLSFLQQEGRGVNQDALALHGYESSGSPSQSAVMKAARILDCYLSEVAPDANLSVSKFVAFAELMPEYARVVDDGVYRAVDVYLKAHPGINDDERKKVCSLMDCQKLSQEACAHAAQNERLPVQVVVQVLYYEQLRLRSAMSGSSYGDGEESKFSQRAMLVPQKVDEYAVIQRENMELKMEVARMKNRLGESDQEELTPTKSEVVVVQGYITQDTEKPKRRFLQSVSKTLNRLNPFQRGSKDIAPRTPDVRASRRARRHSIS